jgi:hypothetical protein
MELRVDDVLVQPEMEKVRSPLVSIPPFGRGFSRHRYCHQAIPQHGRVSAELASVSIHLTFRVARDAGTIGASPLVDQGGRS